jgi:hypothetical protein
MVDRWEEAEKNNSEAFSEKSHYQIIVKFFMDIDSYMWNKVK